MIKDTLNRAIEMTSQNDVNGILENIQNLDTKVIAAIIAGVVSVLVGVITIFINYRIHKSQLKEKRREEKRKEIYKKLNEFYGPFQQHLNSSKELYKIFMQGKPTEFRTLTYLIDKDKIYNTSDGQQKVILDKADTEILNQILDLGERMENLIVEKAGLVDDEELRFNYISDSQITDSNHENSGLLAIARTHFKMIRLANLGKLDGMNERVRNYVFPRELPTKIESRIKSLQAELKNLSK